MKNSNSISNEICQFGLKYQVGKNPDDHNVICDLKTGKEIAYKSIKKTELDSLNNSFGLIYEANELK